MKKYCEWEKGGFENTIYICVCVCMNGEVDFGLRYDPQVKFNKKINKYTNNNNNNKPFVSKFKVNYGFLTNYIGSANGFFFLYSIYLKLCSRFLKKKVVLFVTSLITCSFFFITSTNVIFHLNFLLFLINSLLLFLWTWLN